MSVAVQPRHVVVTRPVGSTRGLARALRARGFVPLALPGSSLRAPADAVLAGCALDAALAADVVLFTSPAAVRFAARLRPLASTTAVPLAIGAATRRCLLRHGVDKVQCPSQADSEGALALPALTAVRGRRVALVTAPGGRGLLADSLRQRGAELLLAHVYQRGAARWDARHFAPLRAVHGPLTTVLTSSETLARLQQQLPADIWGRLRAGTALCGSERLLDLAVAAGFRRQQRAASALTADLLAALERAF
ncbi:MAG TPA: uroporphyrinogen-III synthase [Rhodanobacteraceae bacterium]|nr:uroporphyrinogen-III synthase [Rhodanobacteraceae bacterium]